MRYALIPPISMLSHTFRTDYQLMLPHLTTYPTYADVYRRHCLDPDTFVILDNGVAEGERIPFADIVDIARKFGVDEIVLPDIMGDCLRTLATACRAYEDISRQPGASIDLMFVAQGQTFGQIYSCIRAALSAMPNIHTIGLPRHLCETIAPAARWEIVREIRNWNLMTGRDIHFLGMSPAYIRELEKNTRLKPFVRGVDSSAPFNYALASQYMQDGKAVKRPHLYFQTPAHEAKRAALTTNLIYMKEAVR